MATFEELYGITFSEDEEGKPVAELHITKAHLNRYGRAFGGCYIFLAGSSAQHYLGNEYAANSYVFKFLRKVEPDEVLTARTIPIKMGNRSATTETQLCVGDKLVGIVYADHYKRCETIPFTIDADYFSGKRPPCNYFINSEDDPHLANDLDAFRRMFCFSSRDDLGDLEKARRAAAVGFFTDESFAGPDETINPAILAAPADIIAGLLWRIETGPCVTTDISLKVCATIQPGAFITCSSEVIVRTGSLLLARGLFWADDTCIGSYSATFMNADVTVLPGL